jgi:hypothetical protein
MSLMRASGQVEEIVYTAANTQYVVARMKEQNTPKRAPGMAVNILYFSIPDDPSKKWSAVKKRSALRAACPACAGNPGIAPWRRASTPHAASWLLLCWP